MSRLPPLSAVRAFEAAARLQNFTRAADELGMSQAAISYQIRQLEDRVGQRLFVRERGRVRLSDLGQRLLPPISDAFASMEVAFSAIETDASDVLSINAATSFGGTWLSSRIGRFQMRYPDIAVRIAITNDVVDFDKSNVDVALRVGTGNWSGLRSEFLFRSHVTPVCAPAFMETHKITEPLDLLGVERLAPNDNWWAGWFAAAGIDAPPAPRQGIELDSQLQEANAVLSGYGIALLTPFFWRTELASGQLVQPFDTLYKVGLATWLVTRDGRQGVRKIERFREWIYEELEADRHFLPVELWEPLP
ncbi:MAG: LysR substrate-binding domain-containing protein [Sphingorhabdus sp.]|uniref:LysR substrate-binding domain-containing protein n=1 Tax=Sphingorhabdus sp. TaxID=1902408 RepID=UPI0038FC42ED